MTLQQITIFARLRHQLATYLNANDKCSGQQIRLSHRLTEVYTRSWLAWCIDVQPGSQYQALRIHRDSENHINVDPV